jgi:hypothetical protein
MFLLSSVVVGLCAAMLRALLGRRSLQPFDVKYLGLVFAAFIPQWLVFVTPIARGWLPNDWVPWVLVLSQLVLLVFGVINIRKPGFLLLTTGLAFNVTVIILNGGMMPISPETVQHLLPNAPPGAWQVGERLGNSKDIVLPAAQTVFGFLSDRFVVAYGAGSHVAFSFGDAWVWLGVVWALWTMGGPVRVQKKEQKSAEAANLLTKPIQLQQDNDPRVLVDRQGF